MSNFLSEKHQKIGKMEELKIPEEFKFPFEPYDIQVSCVTRALATGPRAVLGTNLGR